MDTSEPKTHDGLSSMFRKSVDVANYYDNWADDYNETLAQWQYNAPERAAELLRSILSAKSIILDAGCGTGLTGRALHAAGFTQIDGVDLSSRSLSFAQNLGIYRTLKKVDMQKMPMPMPNGQYDGLLCVGVLTYLPESEVTLREFCRVVKSGGAIVLTQRNDLFIERQFETILKHLTTEGLIKQVAISDSQPYLPNNDEYGEQILVHYVSYVVA